MLAQQEQLQQQEEQLRLRLADITTHETMYAQVQASIQQIQQELDRKEPAFVELSHFVRAMRGDSGMGIERYVLGIMLGSITQQANQLLKLVHNGRYQIFRSDEASGRTRKYGLELSIYDSYTCNTRSVVSLSGGENFWFRLHCHWHYLPLCRLETAVFSWIPCLSMRALERSMNTALQMHWPYCRL